MGGVSGWLLVVGWPIPTHAKSFHCILQLFPIMQDLLGLPSGDEADGAKGQVATGLSSQLYAAALKLLGRTLQGNGSVIRPVPCCTMGISMNVVLASARTLRLPCHAASARTQHTFLHAGGAKYLWSHVATQR